MKKMYFFLLAMLGVGIAMLSACSDDVVTNDVAGDGDAVQTKAPSGAYPVKTIAITQGVNTENVTLMYNAQGKVDSIVWVKAGATKTGKVSLRTSSKIVVDINDPGMGEPTRCIYYLTGIPKRMTKAAYVYASDGYQLDTMAFTYAGGKLSVIKQDDGSGALANVYTFAYTDNNFASITDVAAGQTGTCTVGTVADMASFDLNLYHILGVGSNLGELLSCAIWLDLLSYTDHLVTKVAYDANNYADYTYTMAGDKATACSIVAHFQETDEDGNVIEGTNTINVALGY